MCIFDKDTPFTICKDTNFFTSKHFLLVKKQIFHYFFSYQPNKKLSFQ